jgi:hypothetical protein
MCFHAYEHKGALLVLRDATLRPLQVFPSTSMDSGPNVECDFAQAGSGKSLKVSLQCWTSRSPGNVDRKLGRKVVDYPARPDMKQRIRGMSLSLRLIVHEDELQVKLKRKRDVQQGRQGARSCM